MAGTATFPSAHADPEIGSKVCVVPCYAVDAFAWLCGQLTDETLLLKPCPTPQCVFFVTLPNRAKYREALQLVRHWRERGAVCLIARTGNPVVDRHLSEKNGSMRGLRESDGKYRFLAPPEVFLRWVAKWTRRSPSPCSKRVS
jgi:hypothetical protein